MKTYFLLAGLLISIYTFGQKTLSITGKIIDAETEKPLAFATVGVIGSDFGTISNPDGSFFLRLPASYAKDTIFISHTGFETYRSVVRRLKPQATIYLKENVTILAEVQVSGKQLTANEIIKRVVKKWRNNHASKPFIMNGFFRDIRDQNGETVYLTEAAVEAQDMGISRSRKLFLHGLRASDSRIHPFLASSSLTTGNSLSINLATNYYFNSLRYRAKNEFKLEEVVIKDEEPFYIISIKEVVSASDLAEHHQDLKFELIHRYLIHCETYAVHKIEHLEKPISGQYTSVSHAYGSDSLFYANKGKNMVIVFTQFQGKMYLKSHDTNYSFDIVDEKNNEVFLDMDYRFTFAVESIVTNRSRKPSGIKVKSTVPLPFQELKYNHDFWHSLTTTSLIPLSEKQRSGLEKHQSLESQFESKKVISHKNPG